MEILTNKNHVTKVVFVVSLDWAANDERGYETLLFNTKEDAIAEFGEQLRRIKTDKSTWECEALKTAVDEHSDYDEENDDPEYYTGEYDYLNHFIRDFDSLIKHPNTQMLLKSFSIYENSYEACEHTYLTLHAACILEA